MGLISQIEKNSHAKKIEQKISVAEISPVEQQPLLQNNFPATPCPICRSPIFWFDHYGGAPHCLACQSPPSRTLVARTDDVLTLTDENGGTAFTWRADRAADATGDGQNDGREFEQQFRCYTSRDGQREIIERRDWSHVWSMICEK